MKPNKAIQQLRTVSCRAWLVLAVVLILADNIDAIRVYEGTNFPNPVQKTPKTAGISKKSLYISKRSWSAADEKLMKNDGKWRNISKRAGTEGTPSLYKIKFTEKNYMQYLKYIKDIPRLEEYTFCLWYKSQNLSHEQTLFTYSLNKNELLLRFWINPTDSTLRMAIRETLVYKVPANIRQNKWHHICQSWNGVLGEWQVFLDGKRIGAGVLSHYKGTYIPEGGEVTLGQELIGLNKRLSDGMDGEIFGFNLVDEAVPQDQGVFINSQYRPNVQGSVPPFKKLPPIKKTYQEIKAYISTLPSDPSEARKKPEGETANVVKKQKENYSAPPKRNRGNHRLRYPPLRKVVVYNRDDRQLVLNEAAIELNKTKSTLPTQNQTASANQEPPSLDENYSIHSYRSGNDERKPKNYEIYETFEDDTVDGNPEDELTSEQSLERKARENFNLFTARQANKVYTLSSSVKDSKKRKFHFETRTEEPEKSNRRSFVTEEKGKVAEAGAKRTVSDTIPVYEVEANPERRKRSADDARQSRQFITAPEDPHTDSNGFRRLPQIPESFINIFTQNTSKSEMEQKLDQFFPRNGSSQTPNAVPKTTESPETDPAIEDVAIISLPSTNSAQVQRFTTESPVPSFSPMPQLTQARENLQRQQQQIAFTTPLANPGPVNFPVVRDFNPVPSVEPTRTPLGHDGPTPRAPEGTMERRRFEVSSGTDLVMRSYGECTAERGSPIKDKERLVVSWADTPVRIFGGAQVEGARNQCGYF